MARESLDTVDTGKQWSIVKDLRTPTGETDKPIEGQDPFYQRTVFPEP